MGGGIASVLMGSLVGALAGSTAQQNTNYHVIFSKAVHSTGEPLKQTIPGMTLLLWLKGYIRACGVASTGSGLRGEWAEAMSAMGAVLMADACTSCGT
jgi:hypothetical protein